MFQIYFIPEHFKTMLEFQKLEIPQILPIHHQNVHCIYYQKIDPTIPQKVLKKSNAHRKPLNHYAIFSISITNS